MEQYILSLDQGTSSSRAIVFDRKGQICSMAQREFTQIFPKPGWVEHNPHEIWSSQASVIAEAIAAIDINGLNIAGIGITNQRETTIVWDSETEEPVYNAIVWQDRRTSEYCDRLKAEGQTEFIRERTGLIVDAYFSATKIKWILDNVAGARKRAEKGKLMFGTVDSWLIWRLTRGEVHVTDVSNASRTMLFDIHTLDWDDELLDLFDIPRSMLPEVVPTSAVYGSRSGILQHGNRLDVFGVDCRQVAFDTVDQHQSRTALTDRVLRTCTVRTALTRLITRRVTAHVYRTLMVGLTVGLDDVQTRNLALKRTGDVGVRTVFHRVARQILDGTHDVALLERTVTHDDHFVEGLGVFGHRHVYDIRCAEFHFLVGIAQTGEKKRRGCGNFDFINTLRIGYGSVVAFAVLYHDNDSRQRGAASVGDFTGYFDVVLLGERRCCRQQE